MSVKTITNFVKHWDQTWAVGPLSQTVGVRVREMISQYVTGNHQKVFVEFGVWDGVLTEELLRLWKVIGFEINSEFCTDVKKKFKDRAFEVHNQSCENILEKCRLESVDWIVTSIPMSFIQKENPAELERIVENAYFALKPGGVFILVQVSKKQNNQIVKMFWEPVEYTSVWSVRAPWPLKIQVNVFRKRC